jgi:hypothetical protein
MLRPGELIYVSAGAGRGADVRQALVMVRADAQDPARADGAVRLVQDFGGAGDPAQATAVADAAVPAPPPAKRGRGRPPGSRTRKPGATSGGSSPDLAPPS